MISRKGKAMKVLNIGGKDYTFEFTMEASLYNECTEKVTNLLMSISEAGKKEDVKAMIMSMSDIPQTTLTMFYAGLLEHHGAEGDQSVPDKKAAKELIKKYFEEHKEDETGNFYGVMGLMIEVMTDDDFFKQLGLEQMVKNAQTEKKPKAPQDHKMKAVKASEK